jgi:hypothetical protein
MGLDSVVRAPMAAQLIDPPCMRNDRIKKNGCRRQPQGRKIEQQTAGDLQSADILAAKMGSLINPSNRRSLAAFKIDALTISSRSKLPPQCVQPAGILQRTGNVMDGTGPHHHGGQNQPDAMRITARAARHDRAGLVRARRSALN